MSKIKFHEALCAVHKAVTRHGIAVDACDQAEINLAGYNSKFGQIAVDTIDRNGVTLRRFGVYAQDAVNPIASLDDGGEVILYDGIRSSEVGKLVRQVGRLLMVKNL